MGRLLGRWPATTTITVTPDSATTPRYVHDGRAEIVRVGRAEVLPAADAAHPERFVCRPPQCPKLRGRGWINRPPVLSKAGASSWRPARRLGCGDLAKARRRMQAYRPT